MNKKLSIPTFYSNITKYFGKYRGNPALSIQYEQDIKEYKKSRKEMQMQHINDYWTEQTQIENEYIKDFNKIQKEKKRNNDARLRTRIIKNSFTIYQNIVSLSYYNMHNMRYRNLIIPI